jgi:hypothetical protein
MYCPTCGVYTDVTPAEFKSANGVLHCEECHFKLEEVHYDSDYIGEDYYEKRDAWHMPEYEWNDCYMDRGGRFKE